MATATIIEGISVFLYLYLVTKFPKKSSLFTLAIAALTAYFYNAPFESGAAAVSKDTMMAAIFAPDSPGGSFGAYFITHLSPQIQTLGVLFEKVPVPSYTSGDMIIKVKAAGLNPSNYKMVPPNVPFLRHLKGGKFVVGYDVSGVVLGVGSSSECGSFSVGDKIYGFSFGSISEYSVVSLFVFVLLSTA